MMGAVGGGGSLLAIPILVYLAGQTVREAQTASLIIVLVASAAGLIAYLRKDDVRWRAGLAFGLAAAVSAAAGSRLSRSLDPDVLLLAFAPVMVAGAAAMLSERAERPASFTPWRHGVESSELLKVAALGLAAGVVIGVFGVGGGFVIVPVLVIVLGVEMVAAVGTSLLVVAMGSVVALADRLGSGDVDWAVTVPFAVTALAGSVLGRRLADRLSGPALRRGFAAVIVAAAAYMGIDSALALW